MLTRCPGCQNNLQPNDKFCRNCGRPVDSASQNTSTNSGDGGVNIGSGNTLQNSTIHVGDKYEASASMPIARVDRVYQKSLSIAGHPIKTWWLIFAGVLALFANIADIYSAWFSSLSLLQARTVIPLPLMYLLIVLGGLALFSGMWLHRYRFVRAAWWCVEVANDNSLRLTKIAGHCPLCSGKLKLREVGPKGYKETVVACTRNPFQHQWGFDPTVLGDVE